MKKVLLRTIGCITVFAIILSSVSINAANPVFIGLRDVVLNSKPVSDATFRKTMTISGKADIKRIATGITASNAQTTNNILHPGSVTVNDASGYFPLNTNVTAGGLAPFAVLGPTVVCPTATLTVTYSSDHTTPQSVVLPAGVSSFNIRAVGADGGNSETNGMNGGRGASVTGKFSFSGSGSHTIYIITGQRGGDEEGPSSPNWSFVSAAGGGGGTFVGTSPAFTASVSDLLVAAGGGGGAGGGTISFPNTIDQNNDADANKVVITKTDPINGYLYSDGNYGAVEGGGGSFGTHGQGGDAGGVPVLGAGGGAGYFSNGGMGDVAAWPNLGGTSPQNGANGGTAQSTADGYEYGGYGGGGAANNGGGAGGGFSGGGGGGQGNFGGGGGSFLSATGTLIDSHKGTNDETPYAGDGYVVITWTVPTPTITASSNSPLATGGTLNLFSTAGFTSYAWQGPISVPSTQNPTIAAVTTAASGVYTVTGIDANGCSATAATNVVINASASPAITITGNTILIPNGDVTYQASDNTDMGTTTVGTPLTKIFSINSVGTAPLIVTSILGTGPDGAKFGINGAPTFPATIAVGNSDTYGVSFFSNTPGTYFLTITVASNDPAIPNYVYNVKATAIASFTPGTIGSPQTICSGTTPNAFTSTADASGGTGTISYQWQSSTDNSTFTNIPGATSSTYAPGSLTTTTYYRRAATTTADGTLYTPSVKVTVNPLPTIGGNTSICVNTTTTLTGSGTPAVSSPWTSSNTTVATVTNGGVVSGLTAGTTTITYTDINGCSQTTTVTVNALPTITVSPSAPGITSGNSVGLTASGASTYTWSPSTGLSATTGATVTANPTTTTTYTVTGTNSNNCVNGTTVIVTVTTPKITITGNAILIPNGDVTYQASDNTDMGTTTVGTPLTKIFSINSVGTAPLVITSISGTGPDGAKFGINGAPTFPATIAVGNSDTYGVSFFSNTPGTYFLTITVASNDPAIPNYVYNVKATAIAAFTPGTIGSPQTICSGSTPNAFTSTADASGGTGTITYQWQSSTDNSTFTNISGATSSTYAPGSLTTTTYYRRAATTTTDGTLFTSSITVTVTPNVTPTFTQVAAICSGASLSALPTTSTNGITGTWSPSINNTATTTYTFTPTAGQCATTATMIITVNPVPVVNAVTSQVVCATSLTTAISFTGTGTQYAWTNNNTSIGLAGSGTGNIASFTAANATASPVTSTITVTPTTGGESLVYIVANPSVYIINSLTNTVVGTMSGSQSEGSVLTPDGKWLYVAKGGANSVSVYNTATTSLVTSIPVGSYAYGIAVSTDGTTVYVTNQNSNTISVINTATNTVINTIAVTGFSFNTGVLGIAVTPDNSKLFVANQQANGFTVVNLSTNAITKFTFSDGSSPMGAIMSPDGSTAYISGTGVVHAINTTTNAVTSINTGSNTWGMAISPDGTRLYAATYNSNTIAVINTATKTVINTITGLSAPLGVSVTPDGQYLYVANGSGATVSVVNTSTLAITATIPSISNARALGGNFISPASAVCTGVPKTFTITVNPKVTPTFTQVAAICSGTSLSALPTTSTNGITGTWSPALNNTATTTYTFTPTAGQCATTTTMTITVNALPAPTVTVHNDCGISSLTASGYTGSLLWSTGATGQQIVSFTPGTFTVTQTLNGCTSAAGSGTVVPNTPPPSPTVTVTNNCDGTSILTASNYTGTLIWSTGETTPSITVNTFGSRVVQQTIAGCNSAAASGFADPKTAPVAPTISVVDNCNGTSTLTASAYIGSLLWSTGATTSSITVNTAGTYTATQLFSGCTSAAGSGVAAPNTAPNAPTSGGDQSRCGAGNITLSATPGAGETIDWYSAASGGTLLQSGSTTYIVSSTTTVYAEARNTTTGCVSTTRTAVSSTINSVVTPTFTQVAAICSGATLAALPTTSIEGVPGTWSPALNNTATTTYTFTPAANACATTATMTITVNDPTSFTITNNSPTICETNTTQLFVNVNAMSGVWSSSNPSIANTEPPFVSNFVVAHGVSAGSAVITYTYTNANGCVSSATTNITVTPRAVPTFNQVAPICAGANLAALPTTSNEGIPGTWSPALNNTTTTTYTFVPNFGQCAAPTSMTIAVNPLPTTFTVNGGGATCNVGIVFSLSGSETGVNYQLLYNGNPVGAVVAGTGSSIIFDPQTAVGGYTVFARNATTGCSTTLNNGNIILQGTPPTAISVTGGGATCSVGVPVGLATSETGVSYQLVLNGSTNVGSPVNGTGGPINFGRFTTQGNYTINATNTATGCPATMNGSAVISQSSPLLNFSINGGGYSCTPGGSPFTLNGSETGVSYQLIFNGSTTVATMSGTGGPLNFPNQTAAGQYTIVGTNISTGCTAAMGTMAIIFAANTPNAPAGTDASACAPFGVTLTATPGAGETIDWYTTATGGSPISTGTTQIANSTVTYYAEARNLTSGCVSATRTAVNATIYALPVITITPAGSTALCYGGSVVLNATPTGAGYSYQWKLNNNDISGATDASYTATQAGIYTVTVTTPNSCSATGGNATVTVNMQPHISTGITSVCAGNSVGFLTDLVTPGTTFQWQKDGVNIPGANTSTTVVNENGTFAQSSYAATASGSYAVVETDANGCSATSNALAATVNPLPSTPTISGATTVCAGTTTILTSSSATGNHWDFGPLDQSVTVGAGTYSVTVTDANGCTSLPASVTVTANPLPTVFTLSGNGTVCADAGGASLTLSGTQSNVLYSLRKDGVVLTSFIGTDAPFNLFATDNGSYDVVAKDLVTGCTSNMNGSVNVVINPTPIVSTVGGGGEICSGSSASVLLSGSETGITYILKKDGSATGVSLQGNNESLNFTVTESGTYTILAFNPATGCTAGMSGSATVTVNPLPVITITPAGPTDLCYGGSVVLNAAPTGTGYSYQWKLNNNDISGAINASYTATAAGVYSVTVTTPSNCSATSSNNITVTVTLQPHISTGITVVCAGNTVGLLTDLTTGVTFQWQKDGVDIPGANTSTTVINENGTFVQSSYSATVSGTYTVVETNTNGCSASSNPIVVTVNPLPAVPVISGNTSICNGASTILTSSSATGNHWSTNATTQSISVNNPGPFTVTVTNEYNCSATSAPLTITLNPIPGAIINAGGPTTFCAGGSVALTATATNASSYQWKLNGTPIPGANSLSYNATATGDYTIFVTGVSPTNCTNESMPIHVTVNAFPTAPTITTADGTSVCFPSGVTLTATGAANYTWNVNGNISNGATTTTNNNVGSYTATVSTTVNGCTSTSTPITVHVNAQPQQFNVLVVGSNSYCAGGSGVALTLSGSETGVNYTLLLNNNSTGIVVPGTGSGISFGNVLAAGTYTVIATNATTSCARNMSGAPLVTVNPTPTVFNVTGGGSYCSGGNGLTVGLSGSQTGFNYTLIRDGINTGITQSGNGSPLSFNNRTIAGNYTISATSNTGTGCSATMSGSVSISINPRPNTLQYHVVDNCNGVDTVFATNLGAGNSILWNTNETTNPIVVSAAGTYGAVQTDANGCASLPSSTPVNTPRTTPATPSIVVVDNCDGTSTLTAAGIAAGAGYHWSTGQNNLSPISVSLAGTYTLQQAVNGCVSGVASAPANPKTTPIASITADGSTSVCPGNTVSLHANTGAGYTYQWSVDGNPITGATGADYTATVTGTYYVKITSNGCESTASNMIPVTIQDTVAPVVPVLPDLSAECSLAVTAPTTTDNCVGTVTGTTTDSHTYTTQGTFVIHWNFDDGHGNISHANQNVTIKDVTPPTFDCPSNIVTTATTTNSGGTAGTNVTYAATNQADNCGVLSTTYSPASGGFFTTGTTPVTVTVTDINGNKSTCTFNVTVDCVLPVISGVSDLTANTTTNACSAPVSYMVGANGTGTVTLSYALTGATSGSGTGNGSGTVFNKGVTTVTITATNICGSSSKSFTVTVNDNVAPVPTVSTLPIVTGECSATATAPTATDNCAGTVTATTADPTSYTAQGTYTIHWTYSDGNGNTTAQLQTVIVKDVTPPTFDCPSNIVTTATTTNSGGTAGTNVTYAATNQADNCGVLSTTYSPASGSFFTTGTTPVTVTVTDINGNKSTCTFNVTVDCVLPVISNVSDLTANTTTNACSAPVSYMVGANGTGTVTLSYALTGATTGSGTGNGSGTVFNKGVTTVTITATNICGSSSKSFTVTVNDNVAPVPTVSTLPIVTGECSATATAPTATDNCAGTVTATTADPTSYTAQGTYTIHWIYSDGNGNTTAQLQTVIVKDVTPPTFDCPSNIVTTATTTNSGGTAGTNVTYAATNQADNCGVLSTTYSPASGSFFATGTTPVTVTVTDINGNKSTCTFNVTVDCVLPVISNVSDLTANTTTNACSAPVSYMVGANGTGTVTLSYVLTGATTGNGSGNGSGTVFNKGVTTVTITATNICGSSSKSFTVTVTDNVAPVPTVSTLPTVTGECSATATAPTATDNCAGTVTATTADPTSYTAQGTYTIHWIYSDGNGNTTAQLQTVIVKDVTPPTFDCPSNIVTTATTTNSGGTAGTNVTYAATNQADNCGVLSTTYSPASGSFFTTGTTPVTVTVTDINGNKSTCTFTVTVGCVIPVITCSPNITANTTATTCNAPVTYSATASGTGTVTLSYVLTGATTGSGSGNGSGTVFNKGVTTVTITATNICGSSSKSFTVTVTDNVAPVPTVATLPTINGQCSASVTAPTATDNCAGTVTATTADPISYTAQGTYTIHWTYSDGSGNTTTQLQTVIVKDVTPPTFTCPGNVSVTATTTVGGNAGTYVTYAATNQADNCGVQSTVYSPASGCFFKTGTTPVTVTVTDINGNKSTCTFNVTVDCVVPVITCSPNINTNTTATTCNAPVTYSATASGTGTVTLSYVLTGATTGSGSGSGSGTVFNKGVTTVTITATNICGSSSKSFTVTVTDNVAPVPTVATLPTINGQCSASVTAPTATDNCAGTVTATTANPTSYTAQGTYTITWSYSDGNGNTTTQLQTVIVKDVTPPTFTCPSAVSTTATTTLGGNAGTYVTYAATNQADNCGVQSTVYSPASGSFFATGTTPVTVTVTDVNGNKSTCTFNVTVGCVTPVISCSSNITTNTTAGCSAAVTYAATATGTPAANLSYTFSGATTGSGTGIGSGATFNKGVTTVTITASNVCGSASKTFTVTVVDNIAPVPTLASLPTIVGDCSASVTAPTATDNCAGTVTATTVNPTSYTTQGTYTITWTYSDGNGNTTTQKQTVVVRGQGLPVPTITSLPIVKGECSVTVSTKPTAKNACTGAVITGTTTDQTCFTAQGTYTIHWTYTDSYGNKTVQNQTVIVDDVTPPVPTVTTLPTITGQCSASVVTLGNNCYDNCSCCRNGCNCRSNNNCSCRNNDYNYRNHYYGGGWYGDCGDDDDDRDDCSSDDDNHYNGSCSPNITAPTAVDNCKGTIVGTTTDPLTYSSQGTYTIHWKFDDGNGNVTIQNQTVIVKDNIAPVANCSSLQTISGNCTVSVTTRPTATDNCAGTITGTTTDALTYTDPGTYTVHWTYNDGNGNTSTQTQTVIVKDAIAPVPTVSTLSTITGNCSATVTTAPTAKDNCDGTVIGTTTDPLTYTKAGTYTIHWSYSDGKNITTQNQTVVVKDVTAPVPQLSSLPTVSGNCSVTVTTVPKATDGCVGVVNGTTTDPLTYSVKGSYTIHWTYNDGNGNTSTQNQTVTVIDATPPVPNVATLPAVTGNCSVTVTAPKATDVCGGTITGTTTSSLTFNTRGTYTIVWTYNDGNGNSATQNQTVTVVDATAPVITVPANTTISCGGSTTPTSCGGSATATDNCSGVVSITYTDVTSGNTITRTWKATDAAGNSSTKTQTITIVDNVKPVITDPADITISCGASTLPTACGSATATDNCSTPVVTYADVVNGNKITRTWTATDAAGNTSSSVQMITIVDNTKPTISDISDVTVNCNGSTDPSVTGTPTASDACSSVTLTHTDVTSGNVITRTWKATDASGNYATSTQLITMGSSFTASVSSVPTSSTYTGGVSTNLYIGYGAQSTALQLCSLPTAGAPYTYKWSGAYTNMLNSTTSSAPVFTPTTFGYYTFTVTVTNKYGCTSSSAISICVTDIRVAGTSGSNAKVYICHTPSTYHASSQTLQVLVSQVPSHISSGSYSCGGNGTDRLGSCDQSPCNITITNSNNNVVTATKDGASSEVSTSEEELKVTVMPNPTTTFFTLKLESKYETPVNMRVMDGRGRVIDAKSKIGANSTIQIGHNYSSGTYYAELIQGNTRKVVQMIKGRG